MQDWTSDRAQLLSRTIRGVMRHERCLRSLALLEGVPLDLVEEMVSDKFEYVVTCQIYDRLKNSADENDVWKAQGVDLTLTRASR